ncbi:hypothetical protein [Undibacterium sp. Ji49W]|uniref:hypothetical protein n=1 Tax=Undibacterium sp. Ji49W TaxID=3413040 RepID=UPI003BF1B72E
MSNAKSRALKQAKASRAGGQFLTLPLQVLQCKALARLSPYANKLLLDLCSQYRWGHNGDLSPAWTLMRQRGWKSKDTLNKALKELYASGLIDLTRQGGLHKCSLYALGWLAIDHCEGKLDAASTTRPNNRWLDAIQISEKKMPSTTSVVKQLKKSDLSTPPVPARETNALSNYG